jgi:hypothetical protein
VVLIGLLEAVEAVVLTLQQTGLLEEMAEAALETIIPMQQVMEQPPQAAAVVVVVVLHLKDSMEALEETVDLVLLLFVGLKHKEDHNGKLCRVK